MRTFETSAHVENRNSLHLDSPLEESITGKVHVIIVSDDDEITEKEWIHSAANNSVFDFLKDPAEDIYTLEEGVPWDRGN